MLENFSSLKLNHGLMEVGYVDHLHKTVDCKKAASELVDHGQTLSVSMTATMDAVRNLVLGKSFKLLLCILQYHQSFFNFIIEG